MNSEELKHLCMSMYHKGYNFVCFDSREISVYTDVSTSLCLSEVPSQALVFYMILPLCNNKELQYTNLRNKSDKMVFVADIVKTNVIDFRDTRMKDFVYKEDDTDLGYDPIPKYFWRGVASKLNVSGVSVDDPPADCCLKTNSISVWNCAVLNNIETVTSSV